MIVAGDNGLMVRTLSPAGINLREMRGAFRFALVEFSMKFRYLNVQDRNSSIVLLIEFTDLVIVTRDNMFMVRTLSLE